MRTRMGLRVGLVIAGLLLLPWGGWAAPPDQSPIGVDSEGSSSLIDEVLAESGKGILDTTESERKVQEGLLKARVEKELHDARNQMGSDPDGAEQELKETGELVKLSPALGAEVFLPSERGEHEWDFEVPAPRRVEGG